MCLHQYHNKMPETNWLKQQEIYIFSYRGWKLKVKILAGLIFPEVTLFGFQVDTL